MRFDDARDFQVGKVARDKRQVFAVGAEHRRVNDGFRNARAQVNYDKRPYTEISENRPIWGDFQRKADDKRHCNNKQNTDGIPDSADGVPFFIVIEKVFFFLCKEFEMFVNV